jgi:hypothetical protein
MAAAAVRTHQQGRVESNHKSLAESRILMPHALISSVRLQWSGGTEEMDVEKLILLVKDHVAIYDASSCEHRYRASYFDCDVHNNKNNSTTNNSNNDLIVIMPSSLKWIGFENAV